MSKQQLTNFFFHDGSVEAKGIRVVDLNGEPAAVTTGGGMKRKAASMEPHHFIHSTASNSTASTTGTNTSGLKSLP